MRQRLRFLSFFAATIGLHCNMWSHLHCTAAAATVAVLPHRIGFGTHSVRQWQWHHVEVKVRSHGAVAAVTAVPLSIGFHCN